jgi:hypothetical protein
MSPGNVRRSHTRSNCGRATIAGWSRKRRRGGIHMHHRHQLALERASVHFRQGSLHRPDSKPALKDSKKRPGTRFSSRSPQTWLASSHGSARALALLQAAGNLHEPRRNCSRPRRSNRTAPQLLLELPRNVGSYWAPICATRRTFRRRRRTWGRCGQSSCHIARSSG